MDKQDNSCNTSNCGCSGGGKLLWLIIAILLIVGGYYFATRNKVEKIEPPVQPSKLGIFVIADSSSTKPATNAAPLSQADVTAMKKTIQDQLDVLKKNDFDKGYTFASKEFKVYTSEESFKKFVEGYPEFSTATSVSIGDPEVEENGDLILVTFKTPKGDSHLEYRLIKEDNGWKIWGMRFIDSAYDYPLESSDQKPLLSLIKDQLSAINHNDISKAYYDFASKDFQKVTSLHDFEEYLSTYKIFAEDPKVTVNSAQMKGKQAILNVALESSKEKAEVDYRFVQEDGKWKMWGILLLNEMSAQQAKEQQEEITQLLKDQLSAIQSGDLSKAYYAFTSHGFQEASSFDDFKKFLDGHPIFAKSKDITVKNVENGAEISKVLATIQNGKEEELEYRVVQENQKWKILSLQLVNTSKNDENVKNSLTSGEFEITKALIGTKTDLNGWVTNAATEFPADTSKITLNLWVAHAKKGDRVTVELYHKESGSSVAPVSTEIPENGEAVVTFVFTPPTQGWPKGKYTFKVTTSTGIKKNYEMTLD